MYKYLRIVCSIIAAILVTACIFILIYVNIPAGLAVAVGALLFFVLTLLFKYLQEEKEAKQQGPAAQKEQEPPVQEQPLVRPFDDPDNTD